MSSANKESAQKILEAMGAGDTKTLKALVTNDLVVTARGHANISGNRSYDIAMAAIESFPQITKSCIEFKILNLTAEDNRVACEAEGYSTMIDGRDYNNHYHFLMFFRDGKLFKMHEYLDTKLADEVLGPYLKGGTT
jgi:ketosteroid isomerase-like protein